MNLRTVRALLTIHLTLFTSSLFAASLAQVRGTIRDEKGSPLAGVLISFVSTTRAKETKILSDDTGTFSARLSKGTYSLSVDRNGYKPFSQFLDINKQRISPLHLILQVLDLDDGQKDPRNCDIKKLLRAAPERRMIFRLEGDDASDAPPERGKLANLTLPKSSTVRMVSLPGFKDSFPSDRLTTSFAVSSEPLGKVTYVTAGQLNAVHGLGKIKNFITYMPSDRNTLSVSLGFRRTDALVETFNPWLERHGRTQRVSLALTNENRISDKVTFIYGFDYDRVRSNQARSVVAPELQFLYRPAESTLLKAIVTSKRSLEDDTLSLPSGELVDLGDSVLISPRALNGGGLNSIQHVELSLVKNFSPETSFEFGTYKDIIRGSSGWVAWIERDPVQVNQPPNRFLNSEGIKARFHKQIFDFLSGSVGYIYATGAGLCNEPACSSLGPNLLNDVRRGTFHVVTTQVDTTVDRTRSRISTVVKWSPRHALNTVDFFSDTHQISNSGINLFFKQYLPVPEFMGMLSDWEALLDIRNLLDQNPALLVSNSGEVLLAKHLRSFRGGITFKFRR